MASLRDLVKDYENRGTGDFAKVGWFNTLKDDGNTAMVRFFDGTEEDLDVYEVHKIEIDGFEQKVRCLGENCPLCANGNKPTLRIWIQLLNLDEKDVTKQHQIWERGLTDIKILLSEMEENGALNKRNYKIKRVGKKGSVKTTYQYFAKDKEDMQLPDKNKVLGFYVKELSPVEMELAIRGEFSLKDRKNDNSKGNNISKDITPVDDGDMPF